MPNLRAIAVAVFCIALPAEGFAQQDPPWDQRPLIVSDRTALALPSAAMVAGYDWRTIGEEPLTTKCILASSMSQPSHSESSTFYRVETQYSLDRAMEVSA